MLRPLARIALGTAILIDVLRVFMPSLITIFGSAGSTPAELIGVYALSWFLAAYLVVALARVLGRRGPTVVTLVGAVLLVAGRVVLQFTHGETAQLYVASAALLAGLAWLVGTAMAPSAGAFVGLAWGLAVATALHASLDTIDLVWRDGPLPLALVAVELTLFLACLPWRGSPAHAGPAPRAWLAVGPAVLLWGLSTGNTAHAQASAGWQPTVAAVAVVAAGFLAVGLAARPRWSGHPAIPAVALLASAAAFALGTATVDGVHGIAPWWAVPTQLLGTLALGACLGWAATTTSTQDRPGRRGVLLATGFLLFILLAFAYYAAYDLGIPNDYAPIVLAAIVGAVALSGARKSATPAAPDQAVPAPAASEPAASDQAVPDQAAPAAGGRQRVLVGVAVAVVGVAAAIATPLWTPSAEPPAGAAQGLRIAAYNIRMGFGLAGTFTVEQQAEALRALNPEIVLLSEVDRAWFLNGGHDDLRLIADRLGMRYYWAPAADEAWGDALLTNLPVTSVRNFPLVQGGPTGAQALQVGVRWQGRDLTVIATHLQPPSNWQPLDQVEQLAQIVRDAPKPVVVAGDLNIDPTDDVAAWNVLLGAGLVDAFAAFRPFVTLPSRDKDPVQIDHILTSPGFRYVDPAHPDLDISDHRPIAVTLVPA